MNEFIVGLQVTLLAIILAHVILAPYTKVEESFGIQAVHDFLYHGLDLNEYDHKEFPGVVPRSFIGPAALAVASSPLVYPLLILGIPKIYAQYIVRCVLGLFTWLCHSRLTAAVRTTFTPATAALFSLLSCLQFHLPFYASRTLPNTFAIGPVLLAAAHFLDGTELWLVPLLLAAVAAVQRCDMVLLAAPLCLSLLLSRRLRFHWLLLAGAAGAALAVAASVALDSALWGRVLWPEGEVFWFNTVLNKSKEWGVMPFHWYLSSALPRSLLLSLPLSAVGVVLEPRVRHLTGSAAVFIGLYSCLGHKEVRFLLPGLPLLTVAAACGLHKLWTSKSRSGLFALGRLASLAGLALSAAAVVVFTQASVQNYPGGVALEWLHERGRESPAARSVHMDTFSCMTGVTRFGQLRPTWTYYKNETLTEEDFRAANFYYLITSNETVAGYKRLQSIYATHHVSIRGLEGLLDTWWPIEVHTEPALFVYRTRRVNGAHESCPLGYA